MLWQHGLERTVTHRTAITVASAILLAASAFIAIPAGTTQDIGVSPVATSVARTAPADDAKLPDSLTSHDTISRESARSQLEREAAPAQQAQQTPAAAAPLLDPLPEWVQNSEEIPLWSASGDGATKLSTIPEGSYLRVLGQPQNGCLPVLLGDGEATGNLRGWVNAGDVRESSQPARIVASSRGGLRSTSLDLSTHARFISVVAQAAQGSEQATGVPASVTIAQAILESDWGKSLLATEAFNLFGIKALNGPGPAGVVDMNTWEVLNGGDTVVDAAFKAYHNIFESVDDHGRFLRDNPRYSAAFRTSDPREFARRINQAGYATDPSYSVKLISLMNRYDLYRYDLPLR